MTRWRGRVALVLGSSSGGIGTHVADLAAGLVAGGGEVMVCGPAETLRRFPFAAGGADTAAVEITDRPGLSAASVTATLRAALRAYGPDLVHAHGLRAGLVSATARRGVGRRRSPLVVTWHNAVLVGGVRGRLARLLERRLARAAEVTLGASADLVDRAAAVGSPDARLGPVAAPLQPPPGRRPAAVRAELGIGPDVPLILSVGRLHPQKRYDVLVTAAAGWRDRQPRPAVVIAGHGPSYLELTSQISVARAPVTLLGARRDVADLLAAADLAVVTSAWEARQLFAQEALRAGVPLVATAVGGIPELVGDAAVLVPAGDAGAVDEAVRRLLDDPSLRAEYARRGPERAAHWPTREETIALVQGVYAELVPGRDLDG